MITDKDLELSRLRAIIRMAILDLNSNKPDLALICLRYAGVEEIEIIGEKLVILEDIEDAQASGA